MTYSGYWPKGSLAAQQLSPEMKARVKRNRREFAGDKKALELWAAGGFLSGVEVENGRHARTDDVVD